MAADYSCKTISPTDPKGEKIDAIFPGDLTLKWYKYASVRYQNLRAAKCVLEHPERIFYGVREYNEGGWCYTARPPTWYIRQHQEVTFPDKLVFAVYLNPNLRVYECRAEPVADDDPYAPTDWQNRYRGLTWKSTS